MDEFQSTHPAGGETHDILPVPLQNRVFQSTHPAGGETSRFRTARSLALFQSTPPAGGETDEISQKVLSKMISIHSPRGGVRRHSE